MSNLVSFEELMEIGDRPYMDDGQSGNYLEDFDRNGPSGSGPFLFFYGGSPAAVGRGFVLEESPKSANAPYAIVGCLDFNKVRRQIEDALRKTADTELILRIGSLLNIKFPKK